MSKRKKPLLTERQFEVAALAATGYTNLEIAEILGLALSTVQTHMTAIYKLTGTNNNVRLCHWAVKYGLIKIL